MGNPVEDMLAKIRNEKSRRENQDVSEQAEKEKCANGCEYFLSEYGFIEDVNPEKESAGHIRFNLWDCQKDFIRKLLGNIFNIILKARQLGISWTAAGVAVWMAIFKAHTKILIISIGEREAMAFLDKVKYIFDNLPDWMKPPVLKRTETILHFGKEERDKQGNIKITGLNSWIRSIPSGKQAGRSEAVSLLILDEAAFIEYIKEIWRAAGETIATSLGRVVWISTGNGVGNLFHRFFIKAINKVIGWKWVASFYGTFEHPDRDETWYKEKLANADNPDDVKQEHPRTWQEAFLHSGRPYFHNTQLEAKKAKMDNAVFQGEFLGESPRWEFINNPKGLWKIRKKPAAYHEYEIGADVAEGKREGDYSAAKVLDRHTGEIVAMFKGHIKEEDYGIELIAAGYYYNVAELIVEANNSGIAVLNVLKFEEYPKIYHRQVYDKEYEEMKDVMGWKTTPGTRDWLLTNFRSACTDKQKAGPAFIKFGFIEEVDDMLNFVINKHGKAEAGPGYHDDTVFAGAIAYQGHFDAGNVDALPMADQRSEEQKKIDKHLKKKLGQVRGRDDSWL